MQVDAELSECGEESAVLKAYRIKVQVNGRPKRGRGRPMHWADTWRRDIGIAVLVHFTQVRFGVRPTGNREQRRGHQTASSIVSAALGQHHINVADGRVQNIWATYGAHVQAFFYQAATEGPAIIHG